MAHYIGIKQPDAQIKPLLDFESTKPVKITLAPVRDKQDKVCIPFYYVDTENKEYTIPLGSFSIDYKKKPVQMEDELALELKIDNKGKFRVELLKPKRKVKTFPVFKLLKKKQRSKRMELAKELKITPHPEKKEKAIVSGQPETKAKAKPFKIILIIIYALILAVMIFFLITQTFEELSLERLFGIKF
jgi:hypothetical protein